MLNKNIYIKYIMSVNILEITPTDSTTEYLSTGSAYSSTGATSGAADDAVYNINIQSGTLPTGSTVVGDSSS